MALIRKLLKKRKRLTIHQKLDKIIMTQAEEAARLATFQATLLAALERIKAALVALGNNATPELTAAVTAMGEAVAQADAIVPPPPVP